MLLTDLFKIKGQVIIYRLGGGGGGGDFQWIKGGISRNREPKRVDR